MGCVPPLMYPLVLIRYGRCLQCVELINVSCHPSFHVTKEIQSLAFHNGWLTHLKLQACWSNAGTVQILKSVPSGWKDRIITAVHQKKKKKITVYIRLCSIKVFFSILFIFSIAFCLCFSFVFCKWPSMFRNMKYFALKQNFF